jgi:hypothetical protein
MAVEHRYSTDPDWLAKSGDCTHSPIVEDRQEYCCKKSYAKGIDYALPGFANQIPAYF